MFLAAQSGDLFVGGRSSRGGTQKFSRLTSRLTRGQNFQPRKTLRKFFKIFVLSVLATCSRLNPVMKITCFAQIWSVFKTFGFSLEHFQLFIVLSFQLSLKLTMSLSKTFIFLHHFNFNLQEKGKGFLIFAKYFMFFALDFLICKLLLKF